MKSNIPFIWNFKHRGLYGIWCIGRVKLMHAYKHTYMRYSPWRYLKERENMEWVISHEHVVTCGISFRQSHIVPVRQLRFVILRNTRGVKWPKGALPKYPKFCKLCYAKKEEEWKASGLYDRLLKHEIEKFKKIYHKDPFTGKAD